MKKIAITGSDGLIGFHVHGALHAINCANRFKGDSDRYEIVPIARATFNDNDLLSKALKSCDAIVHLAGVNRASEYEVANGNQQIANRLVELLDRNNTKPHILYSNSTHATGDTDYGRGKLATANILNDWCNKVGCQFSDIVLPHVFGEGGRPNYNTVTATLCDHVVSDTSPTINDGARVELLHAGAVADYFIECIESGDDGSTQLAGTKISVQSLYERLQNYKLAYDKHEVPSLVDPLDVQLFNTYRLFEYPASFPRTMKLNADQRGVLYEAIKGGGGGQTFLSWTEPGIERGNHFHRRKFERFLVVSGTAEIRIRKVFETQVKRFEVNGTEPMAVDMPTLHTHSIINTGTTPLLTLFWTNEIFDPESPDTYFDEVIRS